MSDSVNRLKRCPRCEQTKSWDDFHVKVRWPDGSMRQPHSYCKPCHNEHAREGARRRWHENPEWARSRMLQATKANLPPEQYAARLAYRREWTRAKRGTARENFQDPTPEGMIDVAPILEAVRASGLSNVEIAARMGVGEDAVRKGLKQDTMALAKAVRILDAIDVLPVEIGL